MSEQLSYKWVRIMPTAKMGELCHAQAKEARELSIKFITDNNTHYRISQNIYEMRLKQLDRTFLEIFIPPYLKLDVLETKVYGEATHKS